MSKATDSSVGFVAGLFCKRNTAPLYHLPEPLVVATVFKSGTKLLEHILEKLTGLSAHHLGMEVGSDYESADPIIFEHGEFFIWHNVPSNAVKARIRKEKAKQIFLIRNIFDLLVSQYFHL